MEKENKVMDHWKLCDSWELRFVFVQQTDQECIIVSICCRVLLFPRVSFFYLPIYFLLFFPLHLSIYGNLLGDTLWTNYLQRIIMVGTGNKIRVSK